MKKKDKDKIKKWRLKWERIKSVLPAFDILKILYKKRWFFVGKGDDNEYVESRMTELREKLARLYGVENWTNWGNQEDWGTKVELSEISKSSTFGAKLAEDDPRLMPISEVTKISKYKREYLGYLIRQNKLRAQKVNGTWKTTKEWVEEFEKKASERKKEIRKELSEKLGGEEKVIGGIGVIGRWRRNEFAKPAVALIALVLLIAMANITKADLGMMRDKAVVKFLTGYNFAVEKIASVAKPFEKIKIGSDAIKQINEAIVNRKRIQKFEEESKLSLTGGEEEKGEIAKEEKGAKEEGAVAGEESSVISEASPTSSAGYEAGKVTTQDVLGALDHDLTYEHIAEHKVRRWNLNKNSVNSKKIVDYSVEARDLSTNAVNSRSIENKSVHSRDLADDIRIRGNLTVNENAYFNQNVEIDGSLTLTTGSITTSGTAIFNDTLTITSGGVNVTGNSTIAGDLAVTGDIDASTGTIDTLDGTTITFATGNFTTANITTANVTTLDLGTNTIADGNFTGDWSFNGGNVSGINVLTAATGNITTLNAGTIDLGTNTITDGNFTGNWDLNAGNLSGVGNILPDADMTYDIGSPALRWNNVYAGTLIVGGTTVSGQAIFTYQPVTTAITQSSVYINPAVAIADAPLFGIAVNNDERLRIDEDGDLTTDGVLTVNGAGANYFAGNVGIGTTSPLQKLHVEGQCVTGDSLLPIVTEEEISNFKFQISNQFQNPNDKNFEYKRIDEIKGGEYVMSLDEKTGKLVPARIKGLLDMGVQPIFKITTEDGRSIRTTGNHPYLTKEGWQKVANLNEGEKIAVPKERLSPGAINEENQNSQDADQNPKNLHLSHESSNNEKLSFLFGENGDESDGDENQCDENVESCHNLGDVVHNYSLAKYKLISQDKTDTISPTKTNLELVDDLETSDSIKTEAKTTCPISREISESVSNFANLSRNIGYNYTSEENDVKFSKIKKIEYAGEEQVWDIEVEGTHNFIANGIVAHNTYINGNVGIGVSVPSYRLDIADSTTTRGLNIANSTASSYGIYSAGTQYGVYGSDGTTSGFLGWSDQYGLYTANNAYVGGMLTTGTISSGNITMGNGSWIGLDAAKARLVFNDADRDNLTITDGDLLFSADNTWDIGATGATRPRTIYAGTSVIVGGTATLTTDTLTGSGALNLVSQLALGQGVSSAFNITSASDLGAADELLQIGDSAGTFLTVLG
ncbi:MAG: hypothetical protein COW51_03120, partial [Candidatus Moranbacteria bacterium CG17_big_fil_post_rev_8_21_14_2_50_44_12]